MQLVYYGDSLEHHGIKGQRWGIRRFQPYSKGSRRGKEIGKAAKKKKEKQQKESFKQRFLRRVDKKYEGKSGKNIIISSAVKSAALSVFGNLFFSGMMSVGDAIERKKGKETVGSVMTRIGGISVSTASTLVATGEVAEGITGSIRAFRRDARNK